MFYYLVLVQLVSVKTQKPCRESLRGFPPFLVFIFKPETVFNSYVEWAAAYRWTFRWDVGVMSLKYIQTRLNTNLTEIFGRPPIGRRKRSIDEVVVFEMISICCTIYSGSAETKIYLI